MTGYYIIKKFHFERKSDYTKSNTTESMCVSIIINFFNTSVVKAGFFFF